MGITEIKAQVVGPAGDATLELLVDSGAKYTVLPANVWKKIGLKPQRSLEFILADGSRMKRNISECLFRYGEYEGHTPVVLGEENDIALLGVITLEEFNLVLNPFERTLGPARAPMM